MKDDTKDFIKMIFFGPTRSPLGPLLVIVFYALILLMVFGMVTK